MNDMVFQILFRSLTSLRDNNCHVHPLKKQTVVLFLLSKQIKENVQNFRLFTPNLQKKRSSKLQKNFTVNRYKRIQQSVVYLLDYDSNSTFAFVFYRFVSYIKDKRRPEYT